MKPQRRCHSNRCFALIGKAVFLFGAAHADAVDQPTAAKPAIRVSTVLEGLSFPWSVEFLDEHRLLIAERPGRLRLFDTSRGSNVDVAGVPAVAAVGQGGLLDIALDPQFATTRLLYLSYAEPAAAGTATTAVARARLTSGDAPRLESLTVIFRQLPAVDSPGHFGSRLEFARDGSLFVTLGERQAKHFAVRAQDLESHFGKVVRITGEGQVPPDNPLLTVPGARPEIWSYGHRNVQGAAIHPRTGELWVVEHGPKGGDELNLAKAGANYGWPLVTYGKAYSGGTIGIGQERAGIEPPVHYWIPSIATSSLAFYSGRRIARWKDNAFVTGLYGVLARLELDGARVIREERLLVELKQRLREVKEGPDGFLYVLTDATPGRLLRIEPIESSESEPRRD